MAFKDPERRKEYYRELHRSKHGNQTREQYLKKVTKPFSKWNSSCVDPKLRARILLDRAVRKNKIIKPNQCSDCNQSFPKKQLHGHHNNYKKWWIVKWLCHKCHVKAHPEWGEVRLKSRRRNASSINT